MPRYPLSEIREISYPYLMKAFLFSDLHVNYKQLKNIEHFLVQEEDIDLLIFAGDIVNMGEPVGYVEQFLQVLAKVNKPFFWVPGNNDFGRAYNKFNAKYRSLEGRVVQLASLIPNTNPLIRFTGVGGSPASWAGQYAGESMIDKELIGGSIFVSHVPPPGLVNLIRGDCDSPTQKKLSDAPLVHICGHVHHQWGTAYLGKTKIIKLAAMELGYYAILDLESLKVDFQRFNNQ